MNYRSLLTFLTFIFGGALIYYVLFCAFNIFMNIAWPSIPDEYKSSVSHPPSIFVKAATIYERDGYKIPVRLYIAFADTIVQVAGELNEETQTNESWIRENGPLNTRRWTNSSGGSLDNCANRVLSNFETISVIDTLITKAIVTKGSDSFWRGENLESRSKQNIFNLLRIQPFIKSSVSIKSKTTYQHILLFLRANLKHLFYIFMFFQLLKFALTLKSNFTISSELYNRIKWIGWVLLIYVALQFTMDFMVGQLYTFIMIESSSTAVNYIEKINIFMHAYSDFSFEGFASGLLLITFSFLMKGALESENNWALTI